MAKPATMKDLLLELIPHAPKMGLYTAPNLPEDKVRAALVDYAKHVRREEVVALYDGTLLGSGKDGAVFTADRFVFQNTDLEPAQEVRYQDVVRVDLKKRLLGGRAVQLDVNRGRATITLSIDFSGKPDAADYVARFLHEAMIRGAEEEHLRRTRPAETSVDAVRGALADLVDRGLLSEADFSRLMDVLQAR